MADLREQLLLLLGGISATVPLNDPPYHGLRRRYAAARQALAAEPTESADNEWVDTIEGVPVNGSGNRVYPPGLAAEPTESLEAVYIPAFDLHTDLPNVLEWIDHLLGEHDCDHLGYESVMASRDRLRAWSQALRSEQDKG